MEPDRVRLLSLPAHGIGRDELEGEDPADSRHITGVRRHERGAMLSAREREQHVEGETAGNLCERQTVAIPQRRQRATQGIPRRRARCQDALVTSEGAEQAILDDAAIPDRAPARSSAATTELR